VHDTCADHRHVFSRSYLTRCHEDLFYAALRFLRRVIGESGQWAVSGRDDTVVNHADPQGISGG
jgi:hypothetical protein